MRLSEEERDRLEVPFSEEEVWRAVKMCGSSKSPGPDGFNFKFIKKFWGVIKEEVLRAIAWFWENECISSGCNASFVSLLPKVSNPVNLGDFKPISLIGCYYKIIAKVLAERVKQVISSLIGEVQSAFIGGRSILDGVLIANEVVDYCKRVKQKGLLFKVDFEKAYDCINWDFLFLVMDHMGFGVKWRGWIHAYLTLASISILVNGSPTEELAMSRGIRPGDPLSPFLFLMVAEGLNVAMQEVFSRGWFDGIKVGNDGIVISHLQFADDTIFFGEWSMKNMVA